MAVGVVLLVSASSNAWAADGADVIRTHRCSQSRDYCIVVGYSKTSPRRVPLVIAHKVSGVKGRVYWARWSYQKPGGGTKSSGWKKAGWTGDNGRAPGVAVEALWGHGERAGGPKFPKGTLLCTQFKGSKQKACLRLG
ncbi:MULTISPECIES: hypothetical protein [unclassified Streptomyces]|uniref:hypothetical protein n=1 Tax=unclassified Streptomyces TaxID=2593676 RepID=UPI00382F38CD